MNVDDLRFLFSFPIDRVNQECKAATAPKHCGGYDDSGKLIVLRALLPLTGGSTAEAILCANHMDECVDALGDFMDRGIAKVRREDG